jgi:hypothetical protein
MTEQEENKLMAYSALVALVIVIAIVGVFLRLLELYKVFFE